MWAPTLVAPAEMFITSGDGSVDHQEMSGLAGFYIGQVGIIDEGWASCILSDLRPRVGLTV